MDMRVLAIATSKKMLLSDTPIDIQGWEARFQKEAVPTDLSRLGAHVKASPANLRTTHCWRRMAHPWSLQSPQACRNARL